MYTNFNDVRPGVWYYPSDPSEIHFGSQMDDGKSEVGIELQPNTSYITQFKVFPNPPKFPKKLYLSDFQNTNFYYTAL